MCSNDDNEVAIKVLLQKLVRILTQRLTLLCKLNISGDGLQVKSIFICRCRIVCVVSGV